MIFLSKSRTNGNFTVWLNRLFSLLAILVCLNSLAVAQGGSTPVTVNVSMSPPSFLYRDGSWVSIHVSCNSAYVNVNTWIDDTYGWGFATLDSNGDANGANTIYVP